MLELLNFFEKHFLDLLHSTFSDPVAFSLAKSTCETLYMVSFATLFSVIFGLPLGVFLSAIKPGGIMPNPWLYKSLGGVVNIVRSFPFIVLVFLLLPLSRLIIGTSIGSSAAIIPLSIASIAFIARLFEGAFDEIEKGLIEASLSMGASKLHIVKMMISESLPSLVNATTITAVSLVGYSAMPGVVGAGGLGDLAFRVGFQSFKPDVLTYAVICIIIVVQCVQMGGDWLIKRLRQNR